MNEPLLIGALTHCMFHQDRGPFGADQGPQEGAEGAGQGGEVQEEGGAGGRHLYPQPSISS